ncbi:MAG TPA: antibiotic biosynthesis monooxygenase [Candidatus Binatia bacterium]|nr:antibiotic biosynthesis monooxygenase [Candidatus Binatia bacterium]
MDNTILRIWHVWASKEKADAFHDLFEEVIGTKIRAQHIDGFQDIQLVRRDVDGDVEFLIIMRFDSIDAIKAFAGDNYENAIVPEKARAVLGHWDASALIFRRVAIIAQ